MSNRLYSYQCKQSDWELQDPRLQLTMLIPKWKRMIKSNANEHNYCECSFCECCQKSIRKEMLI